jgi:hypothetical protein
MFVQIRVNVLVFIVPDSDPTVRTAIYTDIHEFGIVATEQSIFDDLGV